MEQQNKECHDEINLYDFWKVLVKRKILITGLFIVIVGSTAIGSLLMPKVYRGQGFLNIIQYELIKPNDIIDIIGNINQERMAKILPTTYPYVTDIKLANPKDSKSKIVVTIDAKKIEDIPRAFSEFVDYINNIDVVQLTVKNVNETLLKRKTELTKILKAAPDMLAESHRLLKEGNLLQMGFNPIDLDKEIVDMKMELLQVDQTLLRLKNGEIEIASQPYISSNPVKPKIVLNIALACIFSLLLGILLAFFLDYLEKTRMTKNNNVNNIRGRT